MAAGPEIVRPAQDRPGFVRLSALAVASLAIGLVLSNASAQQNRWLPRMTRIGDRVAVATLEQPSQRSEPSARPSAGEAPNVEPGTPAAAELEGALDVPAARPVEPPGAVAAEPTTSPLATVANPSRAPAALSALDPPENPLERRAGRHRLGVTPGRVAYLRCDGAPEQEGLFPCPRDRALEERAFGAILGLATCRELAATTPPPAGRADAWLIFHGPTLGGIRMRESPGSEATAEILRVCLEARLAGVRSRVESERMTVSFRFDLR